MHLNAITAFVLARHNSYHFFNIIIIIIIIFLLPTVIGFVFVTNSNILLVIQKIRNHRTQ